MYMWGRAGDTYVCDYIGSSGIGVIDSCELPNKNAGDWNWILYKSSKCSLLPSHFSSLGIQIFRAYILPMSCLFPCGWIFYSYMAINFANWNNTHLLFKFSWIRCPDAVQQGLYSVYLTVSIHVFVIWDSDPRSYPKLYGRVRFLLPVKLTVSCLIKIRRASLNIRASSKVHMISLSPPRIISLLNNSASLISDYNFICKNLAFAP